MSTGLAARQIMVYGVTGSGKTTTAVRLSARTGLPWYAIDDHTWEVPCVAPALELDRGAPPIRGFLGL